MRSSEKPKEQGHLPQRPAHSRRSFLQDLRDLLASLSKRRRLQLLLLLLLMLVGAFAELLSISALVPFLAILVDPGPALQKPLIAELVAFLGLADIQAIRWFLTLLFAGAAVTAGALRLVLTYAVAHFNFGIAHDLCSEIYRRTLYQPYSVHVARNSSEVIGSIGKVEAVAGVVYQLLTAISALLMGLFILAALMLIDPWVASLSMVGFAVIYGTVSLVSRKRLAESSRISSKTFSARVQAMQEGLGGIRDVLLDHAQPVFSRRFAALDAAFRKTQASLHFIGPSPRFVVESVGMVLIALLAFTLTRAGGGISSAIPVLGALALGAQRLMPLVQQLYQGWVAVIGNRDVFADVLDLVWQPLPDEIAARIEPLPFKGELRLQDVTFRYQPQLPDVLHGLNLVIPQGARIGLVGTTGSGKSTLMDLVMGLLLPSSGQLLVDGVPLSGQSQLAWQKNIAHVPQAIFLADATFAENIAFGVALAEIDLERVAQAAKRAQIADFIESTAEGYLSLVGERGARLSGGQRQRIGIARAFYRQANVLVFDEATSALDNSTEQSVMEAIRDLGRDITVLLIAHRISTLKDCDFICRLTRGQVDFTGSYGELVDLMERESEP